MLKNKKSYFKLQNFKIFLIPLILFSTPFIDYKQDAKAGIEFQWDQGSGYRRLKWFQKENKKDLEIKFTFS